MMHSRWQREEAARFEERRRAEDEAPRLQDAVPRLRSLRIRLEERQQAATSPLASYTRHIVVTRAPALFRIPCGDKDCTDGGYDLTRAMMRGLNAAHESFTGDEECYGDRRGTRCGRKLHFIADAQFAPG